MQPKTGKVELPKAKVVAFREGLAYNNGLYPTTTSEMCEAKAFVEDFLGPATTLRGGPGGGSLSRDELIRKRLATDDSTA